MTKRDIIKRVSKITNYRIEDITYVINTFIDEVRKVSLEKDEIKITGLGTVKVVDQKGCEYVDPRNGTKISKPDRKVLKFKLSREWRKEVEEARK